jgi:hypothetical protein
MDRLPAHRRPLQNVLGERGETAGIAARKGGKREPPGAVALGGSCQLAGQVDLLQIKRLPERNPLRCALRGENSSANDGWPHWKEVGNAPPYGMSNGSPGHLRPKGSGGQQHGGKRRRRPSINGQEIRQQGCPWARLHCLNSSPPRPCPPLGKDAETRDPVVVG